MSNAMYSVLLLYFMFCIIIHYKFQRLFGEGLFPGKGHTDILK